MTDGAKLKITSAREITDDRVTVVWGSQRIPAFLLEDRGEKALVRFFVMEGYPFSEDIELEIAKDEIEWSIMSLG